MADSSSSEHLDCPICLEPFSHATTASCGHCFCGTCIIEYWHKKGRNAKVACPIDRRPISLLIPNYVLRKEVTSQTRKQEDSVKAAETDRQIELYNNSFAHQPQSLTQSVREDWVMLGFMQAGNFLNTGAIIANFLDRLLIYATLAIVLIYLFFPFDLIPDEMGIIGYIDDFAFLLGGIWFIRYLIHVYKDSLINSVGQAPRQR